MNLFIDFREFEPGISIFDNIQRGIEKSNSAIIIVSQAFVNSIWCKEKFDQCYIENMNDPAFQLFVIMMQPADTLMNLSENTRTFVDQKVYLDRNEPDLFKKIAD